MSEAKECTVKSCGRAAFKVSLCTAHYQRKQKHGDVQADIPVREKVRINGEQCTVSGCLRPRAEKRSLCHAHRERVRHHGDVQVDMPVMRQPRKIEGDLCAVEGCYKLRAKLHGGRRAYCPGHCARLIKVGRLDAHIPLRNAHSGRVEDWCSYGTAHHRVAIRRGKASTHICECGELARDWSYRGGGRHEFQGQVNGGYGIRRWSGDPEDYDALCRDCHKARDNSPEARERNARDVAEMGQRMIDKDFQIAELEAEVKRLKSVIDQLQNANV